jgi:hypothetical protein
MLLFCCLEQANLSRVPCEAAIRRDAISPAQEMARFAGWDALGWTPPSRHDLESRARVCACDSGCVYRTSRTPTDEIFPLNLHFLY